MSDFSLMDSIECGIVEAAAGWLPIAGHTFRGDTPKQFLNLWIFIGKKAPEEGAAARGKCSIPTAWPIELLNALACPLRPLYKKTFELLEGDGIGRAACVHRGLQQHRDLELDLKILLRPLIGENDDGSTDPLEWSPRPVSAL